MKRKLTDEQKRRKKEYKTIFINGKQVRVKREPKINGIETEEFYRNCTDPIWLHQNEMWEYIDPIEED